MSTTHGFDVFPFRRDLARCGSRHPDWHDRVDYLRNETTCEKFRLAYGVQSSCFIDNLMERVDVHTDGGALVVEAMPARPCSV